MSRRALKRLVPPIVIGLVALCFWNSAPVYPLRIFVVFLHEISHGIAAALTGGRIVAIGLTFDEGGVCITDGGPRFLILNAGYLGSLFWGALFLVLSARTRSTKVRAAPARSSASSDCGSWESDTRPLARAADTPPRGPRGSCLHRPTARRRVARQAPPPRCGASAPG